MYIRKTGYVTRQNTEGQTFFGGYTSYKEPKDEPYIVWKTGYVLSRKEEEKSRRISKSVELTDLERQGAAYYQVLASDTACDVCLSHDGAVYLVPHNRDQQWLT